MKEYNPMMRMKQEDWELMKRYEPDYMRSNPKIEEISKDEFQMLGKLEVTTN